MISFVAVIVINERDRQTWGIRIDNGLGIEIRKMSSPLLIGCKVLRDTSKKC